MEVRHDSEVEDGISYDLRDFSLETLATHPKVDKSLDEFPPLFLMQEIKSTASLSEICQKAFRGRHDIPDEIKSLQDNIKKFCCLKKIEELNCGDVVSQIIQLNNAVFSDTRDCASTIIEEMIESLSTNAATIAFIADDLLEKVSESECEIEKAMTQVCREIDSLYLAMKDASSSFTEQYDTAVEELKEITQPLEVLKSFAGSVPGLRTFFNHWFRSTMENPPELNDRHNLKKWGKRKKEIEVKAHAYKTVIKKLNDRIEYLEKYSCCDNADDDDDFQNLQDTALKALESKLCLSSFHIFIAYLFLDKLKETADSLGCICDQFSSIAADKTRVSQKENSMSLKRELFDAATTWTALHRLSTE